MTPTTDHRPPSAAGWLATHLLVALALVLALLALPLGNVSGATASLPDADDEFAGAVMTGDGAALQGGVPARLLDTRGLPTIDGQGSIGAMGAGGVLELQVSGRAGVPTTGAGSVALNVTFTEPSASTYLTVWPTGEPRPLAANLNVTAGLTAPNLVVVKLGKGGRVSLFNQSGTAHVVVDLAGWFPEGAGLNPVVPSRLADTRGQGTIDGAGPLGTVGPGRAVSVPVTGRAGLPTAGVAAVVVNVTAVAPSQSTFLTVWPAGDQQPLAANLNAAAGQVRPNLVVAKVGANGAIDIYNHAGSVDVVVDIAGWLPAGARFTAVNPLRMADTRGQGTFDGAGPLGAVVAGASATIAVAGRGGLPAQGVAVLNVTATNVSEDTFLTVWPTGAERPLAANLNVPAGDTRPNLVFATLGADGTVSIYNHAGSVDLVVDLAGVFTVDATSSSTVTVATDTRFAGRGDVVRTELDAAGNGRVVLAASADVPPIGGHLVATDNGNGPDAFVGQVVAAEGHDDGTTTVQIVGTTLDDAVRLDDVVSNGAVALPDAAGSYPDLDSAAARSALPIEGDVNGTTSAGSKQFDFSRFANCSIQAKGSLRISGELRGVQHEYSMNALGRTGGYFVSGDLVVKSEIGLNAAVDCSASISISVPFAIGPVPFEFKASVGVQVKLAGNATWTDTSLYHFRVGALYSQGNWTSDRTFYRNTRSSSTGQLQASANLTVRPFLTVGLFVGNSRVVGAGVTVTGSVPVTATVSATTAQTCVKIELVAKIDLTISFQALGGRIDLSKSFGVFSTSPAVLLDRCTAVSTPTTTTTTTTPRATPSTTTTTTPPATTVNGAVQLTARYGSCPYGSNCLISGFTISGFSPQPTSYTCIFSDGSRYTFGFSGSSVSTACYTADVPDSITVEVRGVRSNTVATNAPPSTTVPQLNPTVSITKRFGSCAYGSNCLIAGFSIANFGSTPTKYTCVFGDGSRYSFNFSGSSVTTACYTADRPDSIRIEVNGVSSATIGT